MFCNSLTNVWVPTIFLGLLDTCGFFLCTLPHNHHFFVPINTYLDYYLFVCFTNHGVCLSYFFNDCICIESQLPYHAATNYLPAFISLRITNHEPNPAGCHLFLYNLWSKNRFLDLSCSLSFNAVDGTLHVLYYWAALQVAFSLEICRFEVTNYCPRSLYGLNKLCASMCEIAFGS